MREMSSKSRSFSKSNAGLVSVLFFMFGISNQVYASENNLYAGFTYGLTKAELDNTNDISLINELDISGSHPIGMHLGYKVNDILSLETGIRYYGENKYSYNGVHLGKIEPTTFSLSANIGYDFVAGLRPYATIGAVVSKISSSGQLNVDSDNQPGLRYGVGIDYVYPGMKDFTWKLAYEVENITLETSVYDNKVNLNFELKSLYAGVSYNF